MSADEPAQGPSAAAPAAGSAPAAVASQQAVLRRLFLTLFLRGRTSRGLKKDQAPKSLAEKLWLTLASYALFGLFSLVFVRQSAFTFSIYLHAMTFVFLGMFIAASAGEMLFNKDEADILLHRPIAPRILLWAKVRVLVEISLWIAAAFNLVGTVAGVPAPGGGWRFPLAHAAATVMEALFCTGFVVITYQLCLRWIGRERLEGLMTTAQVVIATTTVLAGQLVPRLLLDYSGKAEIDLHHWWLGLLPPVWFACIDDVGTGHLRAPSLLLAGFGLAVTALVLWLAFTRLARDYEVGLQSLNESTGARPKQRGERRRLLDVLVAAPPLRWWLGDPVARASFLLCAAYLVRDRDVKLRVYPGLAPMVIMPFVLALQDGRRGGVDLGGFNIAFVGFVLCVVPLLALNLLQYSQHWQAADLFRVTPIAGPGQICHGARRAVLAFLALPLLLLSALLIFALRGEPTRLLLMLPGAIALPVYAMLTSAGADAVPLSRPSEEAKSVGRGVALVGVMIFSAVLAAVAALAWSHGWFLAYLAGETVVAGAVYLRMRHVLTNARWTKWE